MKQKLPLILNCQRATEFCDKVQYSEMDFRGKLRLRFHLMFCHACKTYWRRNRRLTHLLEKADLHTCSTQQKKRWQQQLEREQARNSLP